MKRATRLLLRRWQKLNHEGLTQGDFKALRKFERAKAIWLVVATAPTIPLMISDLVGYARGWIWHGWAIVAATWAVAVTGFALFHVGKSLSAYLRDWRSNRN